MRAACVFFPRIRVPRKRNAIFRGEVGTFRRRSSTSTRFTQSLRAKRPILFFRETIRAANDQTRVLVYRCESIFERLVVPRRKKLFLWNEFHFFLRGIVATDERKSSVRNKQISKKKKYFANHFNVLLSFIASESLSKSPQTVSARSRTISNRFVREIGPRNANVPRTPS